jgi:uncharacterized protein YndB with AHSA1/START domain
MTEVSRHRLVSAPIERVWDLVSSVDLMPEWFAFADRMEILDGDGLGRHQRLHGHWGKRRSEVDQEITEFDPPRSLAWRHLAERLDGKPAPQFARRTEFRISLEAQGPGQTLVRLESRQQPASLAKGLVMRLFGTREVATTMDRSLDRLAVAAPVHGQTNP